MARSPSNHDHAFPTPAHIFEGEHVVTHSDELPRSRNRFLRLSRGARDPAHQQKSPMGPQAIGSSTFRNLSFAAISPRAWTCLFGFSIEFKTYFLGTQLGGWPHPLLEPISQHQQLKQTPLCFLRWPRDLWLWSGHQLTPTRTEGF